VPKADSRSKGTLPRQRTFDRENFKGWNRGSRGRLYRSVVEDVSANLNTNRKEAGFADSINALETNPDSKEVLSARSNHRPRANMKMLKYLLVIFCHGSYELIRQ
jgi:hypothetical protein